MTNNIIVFFIKILQRFSFNKIIQRMSHLTNGRKYAGDFTFNESGAVRHQPNKISPYQL